MHLEQLINDDDVCVRCGHEKQQHGVRIRGDGVISRVECQECPANKIRGWESTERINYHKQTIDIEDRYLVEHTLLKACWTLAGSLEPPIELSAAKHWRVSTHMGVRRRLVEDLIVPEKEKHILARLQQDICCGCQYEMPIHVLEIDHVIPKSKGGRDQAKNIQLLCPKCNKIKGNRDMEYLRRRLIEKDIIRTGNVTIRK